MYKRYSGTTQPICRSWTVVNTEMVAGGFLGCFQFFWLSAVNQLIELRNVFRSDSEF